MANPPRLVLKAYGELSLELMQYVRYRPRKISWKAWLIFATLSSILYSAVCEHACHTASLHTRSYANTNDTSGRRQSNHSVHI